ncbi:hypothetical protein [Sediminibacterium sp.]|uniref:hypothetical protein n=1 Tax=Sediminibacterium sp. TaxID=1917865 RepID=UPI003F6EFC0F
MIKKTNTSIFLVPTLKIPKNTLKENGFINAFIKDETIDIAFEGSIFLLFRPEYPSRFRNFLNMEYNRTTSIIAEFDKKLGLVVLVYKLNPLFESDYSLIKKGEYSKTSKDFQKIFSNSIEIKVDGITRKELSLQYRVFNKTPDLIEYWKKNNIGYHSDMEIWHPFDEKKESLTNATLNEAALTYYSEID